MHDQIANFETPRVRDPKPDYVVGIGASAGGLEALEQVFRAVTKPTRMAFVVIQHLSPDFKSQMYELMTRWTTLEVHVAEHDMELESEAIYLMPPGFELTVEQGCLRLEERGRGLTLPIDKFMRSCARDYGERSVAIVLSGTGSDGSRGVLDVHEAGGLVVVQREDTAKFDGMPRSSLETGVVDLAVPPSDIPELLERYATGHSVSLEPNDSSEAVKLGGMRAVFSLLQEHYGIDFSSYKSTTVGRRIERRIMLTHHEGLSDYIERLNDDRSELDALYRDLLIGVTAFFRDAGAYEALEHEVIPRLLSELERRQELRVWSAGCATGEEAYSMAILLTEAVEKLDRSVGIKIFATDVHRSSLEFAGAGLYSTAAVAEVGTERLERFFVREGDGYRVAAELRRMIVFAPHNVVRDAPFTKLDLVSCRNMLIYFQPPMQRKVLSLFHFGLRTGGVLFLGPSETPGDVGDEFDSIDQHWKLYRKRRDVRLLTTLRDNHIGPPLTLMPGKRVLPKDTRDSLLLDLFSAMLDETLPPSVLVDSRQQVAHTFGDISALLRLPRGRPSLSLLDMLDGDFKLAVAGALHRAARVRAPVSFTDVHATTTGETQKFEIRVRPVSLLGSGAGEPYFLVSLVPSAHEPAPELPDIPVNLDQASRDRLEALEHELRHTKENLQATIEELEASNEELQATNEELLASNEELQSTNEELHSVNEELYTVNAEFQRKIDELTEMTEDMDNLLLSTEVHTLFLDDKLGIRKFTPAMADVFNLVETDVGRRIDGFVYNLDYPNLVEVLGNTLRTGERVEAEVTSTAGHKYLLRVVPYRGSGRRAGVVLTLVDITRLLQAEHALREQVELRDRFLAMLSHELRNPLAAVNNALALLDRRLEDPAAAIRNNLDLIARQSKHMQRLLDDLLDVSRVTQGKIHLRKFDVDLRDVIRDVVDQNRTRLLERKLELELELGDEPLWIHADSTRLVQIFDNLVTNAIKYTPPCGRILVELIGDDASMTVRVCDNGAGIDAQTRARIFDMFVQADTTLDRSQGGLGVGLTLVRQLVELHGGKIEVHSDGSGQGSEFVVRLPRVAAPRPTVQRHNQSAPRQRPQAGCSRVLIVEDRPEIRETLADLLRGSGYEVQTATSGIAGLHALIQERPHVALVDIGLPGIDGYELARRARSEPRCDGIPLVAMTGYGRDDDRAKIVAAGFDTHLIKPIDIDDVLSTLDRLGLHGLPN